MPSNEQTQDLLSEVQTIVTQKLDEVALIPVGMASGRRLGMNSAKPDQLRAMLMTLLTDIGLRLGPHFLRETPSILLEQFAIMSIVRNDDTAGLLKSLINSFMVTYATPETADRTMVHLEGIEGLRAEVAAMRKSIREQSSGKVPH